MENALPCVFISDKLQQKGNDELQVCLEMQPVCATTSPPFQSV